MWLMTLFLATAMAEVKTPEATHIPAQGSSEGAITSCVDESNPTGRTISGKACPDLKVKQPRPHAPAPANSMQKPGGWMPSDAPGSSP